MLTPERTRFIGDEDALEIWWYVNGALVDFTSGFTFSAKLAGVGTPQTIVFTKTTGFTGAAGAGSENSGTPNLSVAWSTTGELNAVTAAGRYTLEITATAGDGSESTYQMTLNMKSRLGS